MNQPEQFLLKGAEFRYTNDTEDILKGVDLKICAGEWVALLGANGSGKSTLLKILSALLTPTQGFCFINGISSAEAKKGDLRGFSAIVFQNPEDQIVASTVIEEVAFGPENLGCPRDEILERVKESLRAVGLSGYEDELTSSLSGGQKQRLALAGALAMRPCAVLLDEPLSMLDPQSRVDFTRIIAEEHSKGRTIIEVTHRLEEVRLADRIVVLGGGKVICDMPSKEFFGKREEELLDMHIQKPPLERVHEALVRRKIIPPDTEISVKAISEELICR